MDVIYEMQSIVGICVGVGVVPPLMKLAPGIALNAAHFESI